MLESSRRGGTRGGQSQFSWDTVREDKHREHYLGNSVAAAKGRWQQNRDIHWYNKDSADNALSDAEVRRSELMQVKQAEQEAMQQMLYVQCEQADRSGGGLPMGKGPIVGPVLADGAGTAGVRTGANAAPVDTSKRRYSAMRQDTAERDGTPKNASRDKRDERDVHDSERRARHDARRAHHAERRRYDYDRSPGRHHRRERSPRPKHHVRSETLSRRHERARSPRTFPSDLA